MNDWFIDLGLSVLFRLLKDAIKNQAKKAQWRRAMLKLRDAIELAYGDDEGFAVPESRLAVLKARTGSEPERA